MCGGPASLSLDVALSPAESIPHWEDEDDNVELVGLWRGGSERQEVLSSSW